MIEIFLPKILRLLVSPLGFALSLGLFALLLGLFSKTRWLAWMIALVCCTELWIAATPWAADKLIGGLERHYPPQAIAKIPQADVIVVLGGGTEGVKPPRRTYDVNQAGDRVLHAARLYHAGKAPLILVSGGSMAWQEMPAETTAMRAMLIELGVPTKAIRDESGSRNTYENALFSKPLLDNSQRILLVTSAFHMPRAAAVFHKLGVDVIAAPTDIRVVERPPSILDYLPDVLALEQTTIAIKEYLGVAYYRMYDRI